MAEENQTARPQDDTPPVDDGGRTATADDAQAGGADAPPADDLSERLARAEARAAEFQDAFLRAKAEMENVRRRAQEDVAKAHKFAVESFAESLLPVLDSLDAALRVEGGASDAMRSGVELTLRQLTAAFERNRLLPIDPAGEKFDPHHHQAISMLPSDTVPAQHVIGTLQRGWTIADRVLRPALVTVSQGPAA